MTISPLYKCPECEEKKVATLPLGVLEKGVLRGGCIQHVCQNDDCSYRYVEKINIDTEENKKASGQS